MHRLFEEEASALRAGKTAGSRNVNIERKGLASLGIFEHLTVDQVCCRS